MNTAARLIYFSLLETVDLRGRVSQNEPKSLSYSIGCHLLLRFNGDTNGLAVTGQATSQERRPPSGVLLYKASKPSSRKRLSGS